MILGYFVLEDACNEIVVIRRHIVFVEHGQTFSPDYQYHHYMELCFSRGQCHYCTCACLLQSF